MSSAAKQNKRREAALTMFNEFYKKQYGRERWTNLLTALKKPTRYCCLLNRYADPSIFSESLGPVLPRLRQFPHTTVPCLVLDDDENEETPFPPPGVDMANLRAYYLLDAASVLATEALDVAPHHHVLDMCAAPGGKSVCITQRLESGQLVANDPSSDRRKRLATVLQQYIPQKTYTSQVTITGIDVTRSLDDDEVDSVWGDCRFDRVLVDAPCSTDRHVLHEAEDLLKWSAGRLKNDASRQQQLLSFALERCVRSGGIVVYSTCSLADIENDQVVEHVITSLKKRRDIDVEIVRKSFGVGEQTKVGWLVLPDTGDRWGPIYFAILKKR